MTRSTGEQFIGFAVFLLFLLAAVIQYQYDMGVYAAGIVLAVTVLANLLVRGFTLPRLGLADVAVGVSVATMLIGAATTDSQILTGVVRPLSTLGIWILMRAFLSKRYVALGVLRGVSVAGASAALIILILLFTNVNHYEVAAFAGSQNQTGLLMAASALWFLDRYGKTPKTRYVVLGFLLVAAMLLIAARGALLGFCVSACFYALWNRRKVPRLLTRAVITLCVLALPLLVIFSEQGGLIGRDVVSLRATPATQMVSRYLSKGVANRTEIWSACLEVWRRAPLYGRGWDYDKELLDLLPENRAVDGVPSAHSTPIHYLCRGGLIALASLLIVLWVALRQGQRILRTELSVVLPLLVLVLANAAFESLTVGGLALRSLLFTLFLAISIGGRAKLRTDAPMRGSQHLLIRRGARMMRRQTSGETYCRRCDPVRALPGRSG